MLMVIMQSYKIILITQNYILSYWTTLKV